MATLVRRLREGSGHSLTAAARLLEVKPPTLAAYEKGRFEPSDALFWRIVGRLALGHPGEREIRPRFFVTYWLFGQRFLSDGEERVLVFADPGYAERQAERLERLQFSAVGIIPVWASACGELVAVHGAGVAFGDDLDDPLDALVAHVRTRADDFEERVGSKDLR